ncbi:GGDEF domain-containing protein [Martelella endophytica]|uniref:GGDEF domain-containing protein n=1 Tax=Martelella endophytica TaxID=1486262 RepID=UPI0009E42EBD|nr:GGDEF domain-containing protein [Martelella endophytica]
MQAMIVTGGLAILAASFILAWYTGGRPNYLLIFAAALVFVDLGVVVMFLRPIMPADVALPLANILFIAAQIAFGESLLERRGKTFGLSVIVTLFVTMSMLYCLLYATSTLTVRTVGINCGLLLVFVMTLRHIWIRRDDDMHDKLIFWTFITLGVMHTVRSTGVFFNEDIVDPQSAFWGFMQLYILLLAMILTLAILASHFVERIEKIHTLRDRDHLTGVLNRAGFERAVAAIYASQSRALVSLVLFDIDEFKSTNDALGHPAGDAVLRRVGSVLLDHSRDGDVVGRLGGDEFAILSVGLDAAGALALGERIRRRLGEDKVYVEGHELPAACSVGAATLQIERGYETLYVTADAALYEAKRLGRNRVVGGANPPAGERPDDAGTVVPLMREPRRAEDFG